MGSKSRNLEPQVNRKYENRIIYTFNNRLKTCGRSVEVWLESLMYPLPRLIQEKGLNWPLLSCSTTLSTLETGFLWFLCVFYSLTKFEIFNFWLMENTLETEKFKKWPKHPNINAEGCSICSLNIFSLSL